MKNKSNLYLVGIMGVGKTTIASHLTKKLKMKSVDTDSIIVKQEKMSINDIFSKYGESYFRKLEEKVIAKLGKVNNLIVSCGGGIVLNEKNIKVMRKNGLVVWIHRDIPDIIKSLENDKSRPLLANGTTKLFEIYEKRKDKYIDASHCKIDNSNIDNTVKKIVAIYMSQKMVGYLGPKNTFSYVAGTTIFKNKKLLIPYKNFQDVFNALDCNEIGCAIVPFINSISGVVKEVEKLFNKNKYEVVKKVTIKIVQSLCSQQKDIKKITAIYSKNEAYNQSMEWLKKFNLEKIKFYPTDSTASAAKIASENPTSAAICLSLAANENKLHILEENISKNDNSTVFYLIKKIN